MFRAIIKWALVLLPPLLLLLYHNIPIDIGVSILYIPVPLILVWSFVSVVRIAVLKLRKPGMTFIEVIVRGIRPALCICAFGLVYYAHASSLKAAKMFAAVTAIQSHESFTRTSRYPVVLDGWKSQLSRTGNLESTIRTDNCIGVRYNLTYIAKNDSSSTLVRVSHDEAFEVTSTGDGRYSLSEDYYQSSDRVGFLGASELMKYLGR